MASYYKVSKKHNCEDHHWAFDGREGMDTFTDDWHPDTSLEVRTAFDPDVVRSCRDPDIRLDDRRSDPLAPQWSR